MADHNFKVPLPKAATNFKVPKLPRVHYKKTGNILPPETPSSSNSLSLRSFQVPSLEARYKNNDEASSSMHSVASTSASLFGRSNCEVSQNSSLRSLNNGPSFSLNNSSVQRRKNPFSDTTCNGFPFEASSSTLAMPSSTSSIQKSNFKVPKGNMFVNNASNQLSVKDLASTSSSSTLKESFMSFNSTKKSLFESGLDLVSQGKFGKPKTVYSDRSMSNQLMLPDSSRMITGIPRDDEESVAGSVMSLTSNMSVMNSFKSRLKNTFETMESYLKSNFSRTDQDRFMLETFLRRNQEILLNDMQRDLTLAMSFRDVDACSTFNETARTFLGSMASRTQCNNVSAIKSSKDYLSEVQAQQTHQIQFFTHYETSRTGNALKKITEYDENDENDESALFRSKPEKAPKILLKKQSREPVLCQKKSEKQNENQNLKNVIYLQKWFPVADGNDLKFSGTDKKQKMIETKAIKKRIDNRTVELIDGKKCVIQGSPDSSIVSSFPKSIVSKLTNGLHQRWKVLQKDISNCQKNFNSIIQTKNQDGDKKHSDIECTPRTRKITAKEKEFLRDKENVLNSPLNTSTPIRSKGSEKNNGTLLVKSHPVVMIDKNEFTKAVSPEKSVKKVEERKRHSLEKSVRKFGDKKKNSPGKKTVEKEVQKSRSGRTIKPLGSLWTDSSYIFNVHRKPSPEKKSQQEKQVTNHSKRDSLKRKRDADNDNEIEVKPAKVRKNRSEDSVASNSPVKRKKKSPKVKNIPEKKNKQLPARTKSPMKTKSPVKRKSPKKLKSPAKKKSPVKRKSLVKTKSPMKKKSPIKNKSPAINSPGKRKNNKNKEKKQRENSILAKGKKKKEQPSAPAEFDDFECQLDDIDLPEISAAERKSQLSKSQLRIASMETPPLQYFSQNLRLLNTTGTPHQSPDWQLSQHSQSAVRRFEERRAKTFKQKIPAGSPVPRKNPLKNTRKSPRNKDLKTVTDWIGDKDVRSPKQRSKLINLVIPSRRQLEEDDESDSD